MQARASQAIYIHQQPRLVVSRKVLLVLPLLLIVAGLGYWLNNMLQTAETLPIQKIRAQGTFVNVTEAMLQPLSEELSGVSYFALDVAAVQKSIEAMPWVKQASVRRVWPETLVIHIVEQQPLAIWAEGGLVNVEGELFKPEPDSYPKGLPVFVGPVDAQTRMTQFFYELQGLFEAHDIALSKLVFDERQAWQLILSDQIEVDLGRDNVAERLSRFLKVYPSIQAMKENQLQRIDLRYTNGIAVAWQQDVKSTGGE